MAVSVLGEPKRGSFRILEKRPRHRFLSYKKFEWTGDSILNISGWGQSVRATWSAPVITPQNYVTAAQAHIAAGDRVNAEKSYEAAIQLATAELAKNPSHAREMALAHISAEYTAFLARENASDASSLQHPSVPTNHSASAAHRPSFSSYSLPFSIQAGTEGKLVVQNCQGTINAPVHGKNNTVNVHYYSPNSEARQLQAVSLDSLRKALYQHYQLSNLSIQRVSGETAPLEECYINLAIVESQAQREKDKKELEKQAAVFERLPSSERQQLEATNPNKLIALEKLFEAQKLRDGSERAPKRILIQGRAGIGKTTLCKKLVYEYHHNGLWQDRFESVLWIPLRQLKTHSPKRLEDLLCNQYFVGHESYQAQALSKVFHAHQDKTLFILDGLDEVVGEFHEGKPLKNFLQTLLNQAHVVITSRPAGVDAKLLGQLDLELETVGFSPANVQAYIEKCVPASNQAAIQQFIYRTPLIQGLVNIPIQLDALCYSWDKLPRNQDVTMSMLYEAMVDKLWRKDSVRLEKKDVEAHVIDGLSEEDLEELMTAEIDYLGYLAFKGLEMEKIEFSREELSQRRKELNGRTQTEGKLPLNFTTNLKKTSYLHTADAHLPESERQYHFLHLTFQEFFAAKFLVKHLQAYANVKIAFAPAYGVQKGLGVMPKHDELQAFIATHKYNPRYEIVWWMVAGLLKGTPLEYFITLLGHAPRDLIGSRHQQVMMGCLREARDQLDPQRVEELEEGLMHWFHFEIKLSGKNTLGRQRIFSEHLLLKLLDQPNDKKVQIIKILGTRPMLSEVAELALIRACQDENKDVRDAAASALGGQEVLSGAAVLALIDACQHKNKDVRNVAASALGGQSTLSEAAVQALVGACQDENTYVRSTAASALGGQSTLSEAAAQALVGACQDEDTYVRSAAARALEMQTALSEDAVQVLIGALQDEDTYVRSAAARTLEKGEATLSEGAVQALIGALQDENKDVRDAAASALEKGKATLSEGAILTLVGALRDENEEIRSAAARALEKIQATLSASTVQTLLSICQHENEGVRDAAVNALGKLNALSDGATQVLIGAFQHENERIRLEAVRALMSQTAQAEGAVQALIGALQHRNVDVRRAAARALVGQTNRSEGAVQALIGAIQHENLDVKYVAARSLGGQATLSEGAVWALIGALQDENKDVRSAAASALGKGKAVLSEGTVHALIGACQDKEWNVRDAAVGALGVQTALSEGAIQALVDACQDKEWNVRSAAARALGGQTTLSKSAVQALIGALQDENKGVRFTAACALGGQATPSEGAVQALISACQHENEGVRSAAARALGGQATLSKSGVQALIAACQDKEWNVRDAAVGALGVQTALSEGAVQALIGACQDKEWNVKDAAVRALGGQATLSEGAVQVLIGAYQDKDGTVRSAAVRALGGQAAPSEGVVQTLIDAYQDKDGTVRSAAVRALGSQAALSEGGVQALIDALQDRNKGNRSAAARALGSQAALSEGGVQALIGALQDEIEDVSDAAARALEDLTALSEGAILALINALQHENKKVRDSAALVLKGKAALSDGALRALIGALQHENTFVRSAAASALEFHVAESYAVLPMLEIEQIQMLYKMVLFVYSCAHIAPLYYQDHQLQFYTETGPGQPVPVTFEQIDAMKKAFEKAAQVDEEDPQESIASQESESNNPTQSESRLDDVSIIERLIERNIIQGHVSDSDEFIDDDSFWEDESESEVFSEAEELAENDD
ncbi:MAG: HEAT repeat-containing protein [Glomeribacter sp. 1016415]|nr:HEAT repeat-containing protein [Glomeribacter sp. 1016415]